MATTDIGGETRDRSGTGRTNDADRGSGGGDGELATDDAGASWETVASLPASAKLVARTLEYQGSLTGTDLADATRLPPRTVRYAVDRLEEAGVVAVRPSLQDARQKQYRLRID